MRTFLVERLRIGLAAGIAVAASGVAVIALNQWFRTQHVIHVKNSNRTAHGDMSSIPYLRDVLGGNVGVGKIGVART